MGYTFNPLCSSINLNILLTVLHNGTTTIGENFFQDQDLFSLPSFLKQLRVILLEKTLYLQRNTEGYKMQNMCIVYTLRRVCVTKQNFWPQPKKVNVKKKCKMSPRLFSVFDPFYLLNKTVPKMWKCWVQSANWTQYCFS